MYCFNASAWPSKWPTAEVHLFFIAAFFAWRNHSQGPYYGSIKLMSSYDIDLIGVISLLIRYWLLPTTIDAVLATIVAGRSAQFQ